jgi:hypothetical protein
VSNFIYTTEFVNDVLKHKSILSDTLIKEISYYYEELNTIKVFQDSLYLSASLVDSLPGTKDQKNGNMTDRTFETINSKDFINSNNRKIELLSQIKKAEKKYRYQTRVIDVYGSLSTTFPIHWNIVHDTLVKRSDSYRAAAQKYFINKDQIKIYTEEMIEIVTDLCNSQYTVADSDRISDFMSEENYKKVCVREH